MTNAGIVTSILLALAAIVAPYLTRRTAREGNAITGFTELVDDLRTELDSSRRERTEDRDRITACERELREQRRLARAHEPWDWTMKRRVEEITGEPVPDPPPLYPDYQEQR